MATDSAVLETPVHRRPIPMAGLSPRERVLGDRINQLIAELLAAEAAGVRDRLEVEAFLLTNRARLEGSQLFEAISESLIDDLDLHGICTAVVEVLARETGVSHCSIMLLDRATNTLRLEAGAGIASLFIAPPASRTELAVGQGVAGRVAETGEALLIPDIAADPRWSPPATAVAVRSLLSLPLVGAGRLVGVLNLSDPQPGRFGADDVRKFSTLATSVGQLVALARLQVGLVATNHGLVEEVRESQARVEQTQAGLARQEKLAALGETVSGLAHELNNRLVPITIYAESLLEARLAARQAKQVRAMFDAVAGVRGLLDSLLGFARQRKPRKEAVDLNQLIRGTNSVVKLGLRRDGIMLQASLNPSLPPVLADPIPIEQVLLNLIRNGQQAIASRPHGETGTILVSTAYEASVVLLRVRDNGPGIEPKHLDKIMQPFFTTEPPGEGTGLGLSLCYGIMSEHDGDIVVASQPGETSFTLRFRVLADAAASLVTPPIEAPTEPSESVAKLRVLVVDDEEQILDVVQDVLGDRMDVDVACSGLEAIQMLSDRRRYDVVVSDLRMPGLGGREIHAWLLENRPTAAVRMVFATGDTFDPAIQEFVERHQIVCLAKPFTVKGLTAAIRQAAGAQTPAD